MNRCKNTAILICVLITALCIIACGEVKKDEVVNTEESAVKEQENGKPAIEEAIDNIAGKYEDNNGNILSIVDVGGSYHVEVAIFRLTFIDDFTGKYENGILTVTGTDSADNAITAEITFSNEQATLIFTDSTWIYLENGSQYVFDKE